MDKDTKELAREGFGIYAEYLADVYLENRARLNSSLSSLGVEGLQEARANRQFLSNFVELLPQATVEKTSRRHFIVNDQADARAIQASLIWLGGGEAKIKGYPYFILGKIATSKQATLLLHAAFQKGEISTEAMGTSTKYSTGKTPIIQITTPKKDYEAMVERTKHSFGDADMAKVYDVETKQFTIRRYSPGSTTTEIASETSRLARSRANRSQLKLYTRDWLAVISAQKLADLNVFDQLNHLALLFNKVAQAQELLAEKQP